MPCSDVTELIEIVLDDSDCLREYRFFKRSCGQGVGADSLLIEQLAGRSVDELLETTGEEFLAEMPELSDIEEFLSLKHFFAIQGALEVLVGHESGDKDSPCAASEIVYDAGATRIQARILVDVLTDKIKSCGGCGGCGSSRSPRSRRGSRTSGAQASAN